MKVLIFGITGQDGRYLQSFYEKKGVTVIGVAPPRKEIVERPIIMGSVSDYAFVERLISQWKPDIIFQLAAVSSTNQDHALTNHDAIVVGTNNVFEACRRVHPTAKVFVPGSALQLNPDVRPSMYILQRDMAVETANFYRQRFGLNSYVGYLYNHESPLRNERHVAMQVASAACRVANGSNEMIPVGDPTVVKEWMFAGDVAKAIALFVGQEEVHTVTIGSGLGYSIYAWGEACFEALGLSKSQWARRVSKIPDYVSEYRYLVHNEGVEPFWNKEGPIPGIIELGWKPTVSLKELAGMMTGYAPGLTPPPVTLSE